MSGLNINTGGFNPPTPFLKMAFVGGLAGWYLKHMLSQKILNAPTVLDALTGGAQMLQKVPTALAWWRTLPEFKAQLGGILSGGTEAEPRFVRDVNTNDPFLT